MRQNGKYSYGPLIYNTTADEDDSGNFYWNGMPPVGYDDMDIPTIQTEINVYLLNVHFTPIIARQPLSIIIG